jgi:hypothetical protein
MWTPDVNNAVVLVDADTVANFGVDQMMTSLTIGDNAVVTLGDLPGPPPAPLAQGGFGEDEALADSSAASAGGAVQAVPEPGSISLLLFGALGLLGAGVHDEANPSIFQLQKIRSFPMGNRREGSLYFPLQLPTP